MSQQPTLPARPRLQDGGVGEGDVRCRDSAPSLIYSSRREFESGGQRRGRPNPRGTVSAVPAPRRRVRAARRKLVCHRPGRLPGSGNAGGSVRARGDVRDILF